MTALPGPSEGLSGPQRGPSRPRFGSFGPIFDNNTKGGRDWIVEGDVASHFQVDRHNSFAPEVIRTRDVEKVTTQGSRTMQMARPPHWSETPGLKCVPVDELGRDQWERHWDVPGGQPHQADKIAARMCAGCPEAVRCLQAALAEEKGLSQAGRYMVRGGLTPLRRAQLDGTSR